MTKRPSEPLTRRPEARSARRASLVPPDLAAALDAPRAEPRRRDAPPSWLALALGEPLPSDYYLG
jgi:hypothetical protein